MNGPNVETPTTDLQAEPLSRLSIDRGAAGPVAVFLISGILWLLIGSLAGLLASIKMDSPEFLGDISLLAFGRIRPVHLNAVAFGWASLAGAGTYVWLTARLCRVHAQWRWMLYLSAILWNLGLFIGTAAILLGFNQGMEYLEYPPLAGGMITAAFVFFALAVARTFQARRVQELYVSLWYIMASILWFPILYVVANLRLHVGVTQAAMNWWFGHNILAVWLTPIGLAAAYYFIPKVIGRPIYSYYLGLLGFWSFALFYNWNGIHHLIGGPLPTWLITVSIVASFMMFLPVIAVAVNHHVTTLGHFGLLRSSPTLRFTVFGSMCYTAVSFQGSLQALRTVNEVTHFTHFTVAHAHLGVYAFLTMILFGAVYFIAPRLVNWEWPYPNLIKAHFWLAAAGIVIYVVSLTIGGWLQGLAMNDAAKPFMEVVNLTKPYLRGRTFGGSLMMLSHLIFAYHFALMVYRAGPERFTPPWKALEK